MGPKPSPAIEQSRHDESSIDMMQVRSVFFARRKVAIHITTFGILLIVINIRRIITLTTSQMHILSIIVDELAETLQRDSLTIDSSVPVFGFSLDSLESADLSRRVSHATGIPVSLTAFLGVRFSLSGIDLETLHVGIESAPCDLTVSMAEVNGGVGVAFKYSADLFDRRTITTMGQHFISLLAGRIGKCRSMKDHE